MEPLDAQLLAATTLTAGLAFAMTWLGTRMGLLENRASRRRCPSCGHTVDRARCRCTRPG